MYLFASAAAAAACSKSGGTYEVVLSFSRTGIRSFMNNLYRAFVQKGIYTFRHDHQLWRGDNIGSELHKAIEECKIAIVVLSKDYASSSWCLDELVKIMPRRSSGLRVLPVLYNIEKSEVQEQKGCYGEAFALHDKEFEANRVRDWRNALVQVTTIPMIDASQYGGENEVIDVVINEVAKRLNLKAGK